MTKEGRRKRKEERKEGRKERKQEETEGKARKEEEAIRKGRTRKRERGEKIEEGR